MGELSDLGLSMCSPLATGLAFSHTCDGDESGFLETAALPYRSSPAVLLADRRGGVVDHYHAGYTYMYVTYVM